MMAGGGGGVFFVVFLLCVCVCVSVCVCLSACVRVCYCFLGKRENQNDSADSHLSRQLDTHPRARTLRLTLASVAVWTLHDVSSVRISRCTCSPFTSVIEPRSAAAFQTKLNIIETKMTFSNSLLFCAILSSPPPPTFRYSFVF